MKTFFIIRLFKDADSAAKECRPDQVVAELYDGWYMNVPAGASAATGYPITRILGRPKKKAASGRRGLRIPMFKEQNRQRGQSVKAARSTHLPPRTIVQR
jgi:hypothetical protein